MTKLRLIGVLASALALQACAEREVILPGERLDVRAVTSPDGPQVEQNAPGAATRVALPAVRANAEWGNKAGSAAHSGGHPAIGGGTSRIWSAPIGQPAGKRHRITADPVVGAGRVFTLDSRAQLTATALNGGRAWSADLTPGIENRDSASGGGLAYEGGRVFATTGFGELVAVDAASGQVVWRQRVETPVSGAPTVANGTVYVAARNGTGWAVRASDGKVLWQATGNAATSGVTGVSAPAVSGKTVIFPFASGQLLAVDADTGMQLWSAQVAGTRPGRAIAMIRDVTGDPVIAGNMVLAGTSSGRTDAFDLATGAKLWSARDGANSPPLIAGGAVWVVNDQAQLVRLDAATGGRVWAQNLPYFTTDRVKKQSRIYASYGPVLAGGKLFVASSDGTLRAFDPSTGAALANTAIPGGSEGIGVGLGVGSVTVGPLLRFGQIPGGAASAPVIAGQTLYVVGGDGNLHAYR